MAPFSISRLNVRTTNDDGAIKAATWAIVVTARRRSFNRIGTTTSSPISGQPLDAPNWAPAPRARCVATNISTSVNFRVTRQQWKSTETPHKGSRWTNRLNGAALNCPHNETKLKQYSFETVLKQFWLKRCCLIQPRQNARDGRTVLFCMKLRKLWIETWNCFNTVSFQFRFVVRTVLRTQPVPV